MRCEENNSLWESSHEAMEEKRTTRVCRQERGDPKLANNRPRRYRSGTDDRAKTGKSQGRDEPDRPKRVDGGRQTNHQLATEMVSLFCWKAASGAAPLAGNAYTPQLIPPPACLWSGVAGPAEHGVPGDPGVVAPDTGDDSIDELVLDECELGLDDVEYGDGVRALGRRDERDAPAPPPITPATAPGPCRIASAASDARRWRSSSGEGERARPHDDERVEVDAVEEVEEATESTEEEREAVSEAALEMSRRRLRSSIELRSDGAEVAGAAEVEAMGAASTVARPRAFW